MSFANYTALQAEIVGTLHRSDLGTQVASFITLAEDKLNKRLRLRAMETRATASVSTEYSALPDGFLSLRNIQLNSNPRTPLQYGTPEYLDLNFGSSAASGKPVFYTLVGGEIQLAPIPDTTYTLEIDYFKKLDLATDSTNWLLENAPRCYYYGALMEAAAYLVNDRRAAVWGQMLEVAINEVELADRNDRYPSGSGLVMRAA